MSMLLMVQAMNTKVGNPLRKLVLIKLADNSNDKGECYPSYQHIAEQCEISKRSAINHIKQLEKDGLLTIVKRKRENDMNKSNMFLLSFDSANAAPYGENPAPSDSESPAPYSASPAPSDGANAAPRTSHSIKHINNNKKINKKDFDLTCFKQQPSEQVWDDFLKHRKNKKSLLTETALKMLAKQVNECLSLGYSTDAVLGEIMMRGWTGFKSEWIVKNGVQQGQNAPRLDFNNVDWAEGIL